MRQDNDIKINQLPQAKSHAPRAVNLAGFTLMEMIVTVAIFALVVTLMLANFRQGQKDDDLNRGALELASNFRKVQTLGMSGQVTNICLGGDFSGMNCQKDTECYEEGEKEYYCKNSVPNGGYGISIGPVKDGSGNSCDTAQGPACPTTYTLFVDSSGIPGAFEPSPPPNYDFPLAGGLNYALPEKVIIKSYSITSSWPGCPSCPSPQSNGLDVTFRPPKPTPYFYTPGIASALAEQTVKVEVKHTETGKCREIVVNGFTGQVSNDAITDCDPY